MINFYDQISEYNDSTAIIAEDLSGISYSEILNESIYLTKNITKRSLVFCVCDNNPESIIGYIGFLRSGIVPFLINENTSKELFSNLLEAYMPEYVWISEQKADLIKNSFLVYSYGTYVLLKTTYLIKYSLHDDLALLLSTSGSTGSPKAVRITYKNLTTNACQIQSYLNINQDDRPITTLPLSYSYGLSIINSHFLMGSTIILNKKSLMNREFWELLRTCNATTFGGVPYIYEMLKKLRFARMNLPSLRVLTQAGGKLRPELVQEFAITCGQKDVRFFVMYGQTEATARMSYLPNESAVEKSGSIGIPIPGGEFWLEDESGVVIDKHDSPGELVYRGENVSMGYALNCSDLSRGDDNGGILKTGDIAKRDSDGYYYIVGRKNRFLKLFGNRLNLDELEDLIKKMGHDCACSGIDDNLRVFITEERYQEKIRDFIIEQTGINPIGFRIFCINNIPRSAAGKILYSALKV